MWGTSATGEFEHARAARLSDLRYLRNEWDYDVRCNGVASLSSVDSSAGISRPDLTTLEDLITLTTAIFECPFS